MAKNIVLLSDGTGNSSAQLLKTNVWRVYESLQLTDPSLQVACYDDGVGTSSFKPLRLLGGAFGVGLRRNVLRLYRFLCEHYDPGDRIYLFGFSRGAFTIRVLVGLICEQGIIRTRPTLAVAGASPMSAGDVPAQRRQGVRNGTAVVDAPLSFDGLAYGSELVRLSSWAYRDFRRNFNQTGGLVTAARAVRDLAYGAVDRLKRLPPYDKSRNHQIEAIDFVGVWDTVDAYGLPVDELTNGVDRWVWPLSMPDLTLSRKVTRACHVLALDDERNTFHPVLWDESQEEREHLAAGHIRDERISQVWFAGMHSNVGGGYPDDALSYVSLKWMTDQAADRERDMQLLFVPELLEHHTKKADAFGRLYDSRQGVKGYYRYNPRRIEWLSNGQRHERGLAKPTVTIPRPKVHESVFRRISAAPEAYAPIVLPPAYAVVMEDGRIVQGDENPYESVEAAGRRVAAQESAWDLVWQRRVVYFATVAASLYLILKPVFARVLEGTTFERGLVARGLDGLQSFLPALAAPWIRYFQVHPTELVIGLVLVAILMKRGSTLQSRICQKMRGIWLKVVPPAREEWKELDTSTSALTKLRSHPAYQLSFAIFRRRVLPNVFGLLVLVLLAAGVNRLLFESLLIPGVWGCRSERQAVPLGEPRTVTFSSGVFCTPTGIHLEHAARYRIRIGQLSQWEDGGVPVASPSGASFTTPGLNLVQRAAYLIGSPFKRVWGAGFFVPVARINEGGLDNYPLDETVNEITAQTSGELFLFVNDSIAPVNVLPPGLGWTAYYKNNDGTAQVTVERVPDPPPSGAAR